MEDIDQTSKRLVLLQNAAWVQRLARHLLADRQLAEDLAQDTLAAGLGAPVEVRDNPERFRRWLGGVTRHLASRVQRREAERPGRESTAAENAQSQHESEPADRLRLHRRLTTVVLAMGEPHRSTLVMRFFDDLEPQEIARRVGVPPATVRKRLSRAVALLRVKLDAEFEGGRQGWCSALLGLLGKATGPASTVGASQVLWPAAALLVAASATAAIAWIRHHEPTESDVLVIADAVAPHSEEATARRESLPEVIVEPTKPGRTLRAAAGTTPPLELLVIDENGTALENALVCVLGEGRLLASGRTNKTGRVVLGGYQKEGQLVIQAQGHPLSLHSLPELTGEHSSILRPGTSLSGWVSVDGAIPREPLQLELRSYNNPLSHLADEMLGLLTEQGLRPLNRKRPTSRDGAFQFDDLPRDWTGSLSPPQTHWFVDAPEGVDLKRSTHRLSFPGPAQGLQLHATQLPLVQGRVLAADTGLPLPTAVLMVIATFSNNRNSPSTGIQTDDKAQFILGLTAGSSSQDHIWSDPDLRPEILSVRLSASAPGYPESDWTFEGQELGQWGEVGDLLLQPGRHLHFLVRDTAGHPIAGAKLFAGEVSPPSNAQGHLLWKGAPPGLTNVLIGSPSHRIIELSIPQDSIGSETPMEVVLEAGNRLELVLKGTPTALAGVTQVKISGTRGFYEEGYTGNGGRLHWDFGTTFMSHASWGADGGYTVFRPGKEGHLTFLSVLPDLDLEVEVQARLKQTLLRTTIRGPAHGQILLHELEIKLEPFTLPVNVQDEFGKPLENVALRLHLGTSVASSTTDRSGSARFGGMYAVPDPVTLSATLPGFASLELEGILIAQDIPLPLIVMQRGLDVRVRAVDASGKVLQLGRVGTHPQGHRQANGKRAEPGVLLVRDLPATTLVFEGRFGHRTYTLEHDTAKPDATFVLPVHGSLELELSTEVVPMVQQELLARITPVDEPQAEQKLEYDKQKATWGDPLPRLPGIYRVQLERRFFDQETGEWVEDPEGLSHQIEIRAGQKLQLTLGS